MVVPVSPVSKICKTIAVVSSGFFPKFGRGWHEYRHGRKALLIPNVHNGHWEGERTKENQERIAKETRRLMDELRRAIGAGKIDHLFVSVDHPYDGFLVNFSKLMHRDRVTYVTHNVDYYGIKHLITGSGHGSAPKLKGDITKTFVCEIRRFKLSGHVLTTKRRKKI